MFKFESDKCYRMPAHFGGAAFNLEERARYHDVTSLAYRYRTDGDRLSQLVPDRFELTAPELNLVYQQCRQVEWMAGSYYNLIWVSAPVRFNGQQDRLEGAFSLVIWENKTTPILTGREMGLPKIFADIEDLHIVGDSYRTRASYEGSTFLELEMHGGQPMEEAQVKALPVDPCTFGWRYVQRIGGGGAEVSQPVLFPSHIETTSGETATGSVRWSSQTWEQNPMQWHIIKALAELPCLEMSPVTLTRGRVTLMDSRARVLA